MIGLFAGEECSGRRDRLCDPLQDLLIERQHCHRADPAL